MKISVDLPEGSALRIAFCVLWLFALSSLGMADSGSEKPMSAPRVVVTIKPIHALVANVMAGVGEPELLIDGAQSPHGFSLRPSDARAIAHADVFIFVSEATEPFATKIQTVLPKGATSLKLIEIDGLALLQKRFGATFERHNHDEDENQSGQVHDEHDDDHEGSDTHGQQGVQNTGSEHGRDQTNIDGHIWLDPENAKVIVRFLAQALSQRWPKHKTIFETNAGTTIKRLDDLTSALTLRLAPVAGRPFIVFHDAFQYFEKRFGLTASGAVTLNPEIPPGAKRLSKLRATMTSLRARCMFAEPQFGDRVLRSVSEGTGAQSGILDPLGANLKPGPNLFFDLLQGLADNMRACLAS